LSSGRRSLVISTSTSPRRRSSTRLIASWRRCPMSELPRQSYREAVDRANERLSSGGASAAAALGLDARAVWESAVATFEQSAEVHADAPSERAGQRAIAADLLIAGLCLRVELPGHFVEARRLDPDA